MVVSKNEKYLRKIVKLAVLAPGEYLTHCVQSSCCATCENHRILRGRGIEKLQHALAHLLHLCMATTSHCYQVLCTHTGRTPTMRISIQPAHKEIHALLYLGFPVHSSPCVIEVDSFMKTLHVIADDRVNCIIVSIF